MRVAHGTIVSGKVVLDDPLPEGADVVVLCREAAPGSALSPAELMEIQAGLDEADRGETIPGDELLERLRRHG